MERKRFWITPRNADRRSILAECLHDMKETRQGGPGPDLRNLSSRSLGAPKLALSADRVICQML